MSERGAPNFILDSGMKFKDITAALEYLHVGTADIAASASSLSPQKLRGMLARFHLHRPVLRIFLSLPLHCTLN